jgi:hypothetical protein
VGEAAAHAAWLLVQRAPPDFQEKCMPLLEGADARDNANRRGLAYPMDRVLMHQGQPQIYGTQYLHRDGTVTLRQLQDPGGLDEGRAALGLEPEAQTGARLPAATRAAASDREKPPSRDG